MFEDSTFESTGRIHTRSRRWMIAAFAFNTSILLALVLIPLICPEALPRQVIAFLMEAPLRPLVPATPPHQTTRPIHNDSEIKDGHIFAPSKIPEHISYIRTPEQDSAGDFALETGADPTSTLFRAQTTPRIVHPEVRTPVRISTAVEAGLLINKTMPVYPAIGIAAHTEGTVILEATISRTGSIENLRVVSGPPLLRQAALDAVKNWLYRPYLLDGQPVEVATTVNVNFNLSR